MVWVLGLLGVVWITYAVFLIWVSRWRLRRYPSFSQRPTVAVLIPTRNEAANLPACLHSLLQQEWPPDEIWVIDDHSEDETLAIAREYAQKHPHIRVSALSPTHQGKKAALAYGIAHTQADIIVTTDADTIHPSDTMGKLVAPFAQPEVQVAGGWIRLRPEGSFLNALQRIEMAGVLQLTAGSWQRGFPLTANGAVLAYRRTAFEAVGGWGQAHAHPSGDDDLLVQRICVRYGPKALAFTEAVVETQAAPTWGAFVHQRLRWLSKRHLYPMPYTRAALAIIGLGQGIIPLGLLIAPRFTLLTWGLLFLLQSWIAIQGFRNAKAPLPAVPLWVFVGVVFPFYSLGMALLAIRRGTFSWKGRSYTTMPC